jgi:GxxExxY protein
MVTNLKYEDVTSGIINAFYHVYNALGYGFLEKVYENALAYELRLRGFAVDAQKPIAVWYDGIMVGDYFADLVVNQCVIIEMKCSASINPAHEAQLVNYLKATGMEVGLLLNFGPKPEFKRKIFSQHAVIHQSNSYPR